MQDIQNSPADVALPIDRVGVKQLQIPLLVADKAQGWQHTVATVDIGVDLPAAYKGTHMSRFVEALENFTEKLEYASLKQLLEDIKIRLHAQKAFVLFAFPYFVKKQAPATKIASHVCYQCKLTGEISNGKPSFLLELEVPVMTVCPCSKAISDEGAHSQRAIIRMALRMTHFSWIEEFIELAEKAGSSPVYTLLKRADEKFVTENAFAHPTFVEDVVRNVAQALSDHGKIAWFKVEVESFESIHCHNAFAQIERTLKNPA